jgi:hypothetical protein
VSDRSGPLVEYRVSGEALQFLSNYFFSYYFILRLFSLISEPVTIGQRKE